MYFLELYSICLQIDFDLYDIFLKLIFFKKNVIVDCMNS